MEMFIRLEDAASSTKYPPMRDGDDLRTTSVSKDENGISRDDIARNLIAALLAVNNWPIEKAWEIVPDLERQGLLDFASVASMGHRDVFDRLRAAGYTKSDYVVGLVGDRLLGLAGILSRGGLSKIEQLVRNRQDDELEKFLLDIKGIGPVVLGNFNLLLGRKSSEPANPRKP